MTPTNAPGLRAVVEKFLRDNDPEGFGCACEPGRLCGPCMWTKRTEPLRAALATPPVAVQPQEKRICGFCGVQGCSATCGFQYYETPLASSPAVQAVPEGWKLVAIPTEWTDGPNVFKDWCGQWFGPDSDDDHLLRAVNALLHECNSAGLALAEHATLSESNHQAREALAGLVQVIESAGLHNLTRGVQLGPTAWFVKACDAMKYAKDVLAPTDPSQQGCAPAATAARSDVEDEKGES